jgi:hypothetical protein
MFVMGFELGHTYTSSHQFKHHRTLRSDDESGRGVLSSEAQVESGQGFSAQLRDQLAGEQLRRDAQVAGVGAKLGQEAFGGVVARIRRKVGKEIL